jgi:hypothetical protein
LEVAGDGRARRTDESGLTVDEADEVESHLRGLGYVE